MYKHNIPKFKMYTIEYFLLIFVNSHDTKRFKLLNYKTWNV